MCNNPYPAQNNKTPKNTQSKEARVWLKTECWVRWGKLTTISMTTGRTGLESRRSACNTILTYLQFSPNNTTAQQKIKGYEN